VGLGVSLGGWGGCVGDGGGVRTGEGWVDMSVLKSYLSMESHPLAMSWNRMTKLERKMLPGGWGVGGGMRMRKGEQDVGAGAGASRPPSNGLKGWQKATSEGRHVTGKGICHYSPAVQPMVITKAPSSLRITMAVGAILNRSIQERQRDREMTEPGLKTHAPMHPCSHAKSN
jgi:hypothetical protein